MLFLLVAYANPKYTNLLRVMGASSNFLATESLSLDCKRLEPQNQPILRKSPKLLNIKGLGFPVFSTGICPNSIRIHQVPEGSSIHFELNQPIEVAGQLIRPGEIVVGDHDGLIVLSADELEVALKEAEKVVESEQNIFRGLEEGLSFRELAEEWGSDHSAKQREYHRTNSPKVTD